MSLPAFGWIAIVCGAVLIGLPDRPRLHWLGVCSAMAVWGTLIATLAAQPRQLAIDAISNDAVFAVAIALVWSLGFSTGIASPATWGRRWLTLGGLTAVASSRDWLLLGLGWELVRRATSSARTAWAEISWWISLPFWLGAAAWLFCTGSWDFREMTVVLQGAYAPADGADAWGRPALVLPAGLCLMIFATLIPCLTPSWRSQAEPEPVVAVTARQLAALFLIERCCRELHWGLEASLTWLLMVAAGIAWLCAVWQTVQPSRLDRLWLGCSYWHLAVALTWLLMDVANHTAAAVSRAPHLAATLIRREMLHAILVLSGATAAVRLVARPGGPVRYLEELRGAGREQPLWAALFLIPLASLMGLPLFWGGWLRWLSLIEQYNAPQPGPNDTLMPHAGVLVVQVLGTLCWIVLAGAVLTVFRTLLWEHPTEERLWRWGWWPSCLAAVAAVLLLAGGLVPSLWLP